MNDRTGIGGNSPPAHEAIALEVESLFALISDTIDGTAVSNDQQDKQLDGLAKDIRALKNKAEDSRKTEKEPHLEAGRAVDAAYKPVTARCDAALAEIKALLTPYRVAKQKARDEAERKAREEAERKAEEARNAHKAAETLEERFEAESRMEEAKKAEQAATRINRAPTGLRTYQIATVTDRKAALLWIAKNDPDALDGFVAEYAKRHAPTRPMDGVEVNEEKRAA